MTANVQPDQDLTQQLATLEDTVGTLQNHDWAADNIDAGLEYLYERGADAEALAVIQENASYLATAAQQQAAGLQAALTLARQIREQRDQTRASLDELRRALRQVDTSVPEIAAIFDEVQEYSEMYFLETVWEFFGDTITMNSPLEYYEANELVDILTGDVIEADSMHWEDLKEWMRQVVESAEVIR